MGTFSQVERFVFWAGLSLILSILKTNEGHKKKITRTEFSCLCIRLFLTSAKGRANSVKLRHD